MCFRLPFIACRRDPLQGLESPDGRFMGASTKAVFLSYASQDADAAKRICDALRGAGLEVWFDQNALRGGDAWDALIRRQIRDCALFVPIISANTDARSEGYFRLEWKLAVERSHLMADDQLFLLPVVIDATIDANARVPEKFREVQWTRLPAGETPAVFAERVQRLLSDGAVPPSPAAPPRAVAAVAPAEVASIRDALSIAVLPFVNMGGDPEQDYFADGITEDIITELSRWRSLAVTSRNSTFRFKGKAVDMQRVGGELGVRFLVEGSIRRMGERIRVTAQLIDAGTGNHVWGERFDRPLADLFAVQDEVVHTIVGTLVGRVHASGADRVRRKPPASLDAYDLMLRGNALSWDDPASAAEAKRAFERAIEIDPEYGLAHSLLAVLIAREWERDLSASSETLDRAFALALRAVELADDESTCHTILGQICLERRSFDLALRHTARGVEINPANQWNRADLGCVLSYLGRAREGIEMLRSARRVDPYFGPPWYWRGLGLAQFVLRCYDDALPDIERGVTSNSLRALAIMAGCCAKLGLRERARETVARCLAIQPGATVDKLVARVPFKETGDSDHLAESLRLAGMPE
jgi:TolB-like protein/tetratricopeptide (TPR) repeat protein